MLFLAPALLWFLAAASLPVVIHLLNRRRHKTVPWAAMQFLLKATRESRGKKKLRHILILTCRTLALLALVVAAARPVISGFLGWGSPVDTVVLLFDRSASMELRSADGTASRREAMLAQVAGALRHLDASRVVLIDSASQTPQEISSPEVLQQLAATSATDTAADIPALLTRAAEFLSDAPGRAEIWIASDLQTSNWQPEDERWSAARATLAALPRQPMVRVLGAGESSAPNTSLNLVATRRSAEGLMVELELFRNAETRGSSSIPLTTHLGGTSTTESVTLPGQALRITRQLPIPPGNESGFGWFSIPADGNPRDNAAFFAFGPAKPAHALVVADPGESLDYLMLAAAPPGLNGVSARSTRPAAAAAEIRADDAAIVWAAPLPGDPTTTAALQRFASSGGQVVFFPPGKPDNTGFGGLNWENPSEAPAGKFLMLKDWNRSDGPLRDSADGTSVAANALKAVRRQAPGGEATHLAAWEDGTPFLTRRVIDLGTLWMVGSLPDYRWSNLGDGDVLLPIIQRIIQDGAARFDASYLTTVQAANAKPASGEVLRRIDDFGTPDPANAAFEAGVFRLRDAPLAVNRPPSEDAPETVSRDLLAGLFQGVPHRLMDADASNANSDIAYDAWRLFLVACLLFLTAEALLCLPPPAGQELPPSPAPHRPIARPA